ncbi:MAG TPA: DNA repair protein RecO [Planctomycetota bacterium]|nr:DNA repair protein RecO [Planctomycetota bacterium]
MLTTRHRKTLALVLRVIDYSETSQVVHLYARELGRVHAIAKGSKRKKSAFRGGFDVATLVEILRIEKEPGTLDLLTSAETLEVYPELRRDWGRFSAAAYVLDLLDEFTPEGMAQPDLFDGARATLDALDAGAAVTESVFRFEAGFLDLLGHFPRLDACGTCRRPLSGSDAWFSVRDGGVHCGKCPPRDPLRLPVKRVVLDGLAALRQGRPFNLKIYAGFASDLRRLLDFHIKYVFDREPKSARFMREAVLR